MIDWIELSNDAHLVALTENSSQTLQVIFKHSTRCSISSMALSRLERSASPMSLHFHLLDLIKFRGLSNKIEEQFNVNHESPQVLIIKNGECIYDESHSGISMDEIMELASN